MKFGCGGLALFALLIIFAGGAWLASGGMTDAMDLVLGMTLGELQPLYTSDVTEAEKKALESEVERLRENMRSGRVTIQQIEPVMQAMRRATSDAKVAPPEVEEIAEAAKKINAAKRNLPAR